MSDTSRNESINRLAAFIRRIDGNHDMGAGELAERIVDDYTTEAEDWRRQVLDTFGYDDTPENAAEVLTYQPVWKAEQAAEVAKLRAELHNAEMTIDTLSDPVAREILAGNTTEDDWEEATAPHLLADGDQS